MVQHAPRRRPSPSTRQRINNLPGPVHYCINYMDQIWHLNAPVTWLSLYQEMYVHCPHSRASTLTKCIRNKCNKLLSIDRLEIMIAISCICLVYQMVYFVMTTEPSVMKWERNLYSHTQVHIGQHRAFSANSPEFRRLGWYSLASWTSRVDIHAVFRRQLKLKPFNAM